MIYILAYVIVGLLFFRFYPKVWKAVTARIYENWFVEWFAFFTFLAVSAIAWPYLLVVDVYLAIKRARKKK